MITGIISLSFCFVIEFSQLYHAEWIDQIRDTSLGGLVLGYGFLWSDIEAYTIRIAACAAIELLVWESKSAAVCDAFFHLENNPH